MTQHAFGLFVKGATLFAHLFVFFEATKVLDIRYYDRPMGKSLHDLLQARLHKLDLDRSNEDRKQMSKMWDLVALTRGRHRKGQRLWTTSVPGFSQKPHGWTPHQAFQEDQSATRSHRSPDHELVSFTGGDADQVASARHWAKQT